MIQSCLHRICCCSVTKSIPTVCKTKDCNMPGSSILDYGQEFAQIHVHWVCDRYYLIISYSATLFSFCLQSFPTSESFPKIWLLTSSRQSIRASASASILPMNIQDWFPLGLTGLSSLSSRNSQESFPALQIESTNSLLLRLLYGA